MKYSPWFGAIALFASLLAPPGLAGRAFGSSLFGDSLTETVWAVPTSSVVATSYVVPTSYYVPTTYVSSYVPTTYTVSPTAYLMPTYYTSTRYVTRRPLFARTAYYSPTAYYLPTSYYSPTVYYSPTSYYTPTVYDYSVVPASIGPCDDSAPPARSQASEPTKSAQETNSAQPNQNRARPPATIPSRVAGDPGQDEGNGSVTAEVPANAEIEDRGRPNPADLNPSPPAPAVPAPAPIANDALRGNAPAEKPAPKKEVAAPRQPAAAAAPPDNDPTLLDLPPERLPERRDARKPVGPSQTLANILSGTVESKKGSALESGVRITVSNSLHTHADRVAESDALGRFAIRLVDGDWVVKVQTRDGRDFAVKRVTVSGGQITDDKGQYVLNLTIRR